MGDFTRRSDFSDVKDKIDVTCLVVTGNRAVAGGLWPGQPNPANTLFVVIEDNGPSGDLMNMVSSLMPADQAGCALAGSLVSTLLFPVEGDFRVNDAIPAT